MAGIMLLKRPSPNHVIVSAIFVTPFLVAAMVWYPWLTAVLVLGFAGSCWCGAGGEAACSWCRRPSSAARRGRPCRAGRSLPQLGIFINTHNDYLRPAAETGIVPALLLICRAVRRAAGTHEHILASVVTA
jgi:hypothetical protein